jgi:hypothetical protein
MEFRAWYCFGDLLSNAVVALLTALAADALFSPDWSMFTAMVAAMALGMAIANACCLLVLMRCFGAMEIMLPAMLTGMLVGMAVGMSRTMSGLATLDHVLLALVIALLTTVAVWGLDQHLSGEQLPQPAPGNPRQRDRQAQE